jgi:HlyD family secretion protein
MPPRQFWLSIVLGLVGTVALRPAQGGFAVENSPPAALSVDQPVKPAVSRTERVVLACMGRIEGASETVNIGAGISGVLKSVPVEEGQLVKAGDVLAEFDCGDIQAEVVAAEAALAVAVQSRERLLRGSREEERKEARSAVKENEAVAHEAHATEQRIAKLFATKIVSPEEFDRARRASEVAAAALQRAREHADLVDAPPLPEDLAKADAEAALAGAQLLAAKERLGKCTVRAPFAATVVRRHLRGGEPVSVSFPHIIVSLADTSRRRVRAEIDERDVGLIAVGQEVLVTADALHEPLVGRVHSIGYAMGRKNVYNSDPADKKDRDVLEVLVDLDRGSPPLPIGLRVTIRVLQ